MLLLPLLAAAALTAAPAPSAEDKALFAAFKQVCSKVRKFDDMGKAARKRGWVAVDSQAHPNLALLVEGGRAAVLKDEPDANLTGQQFTRTLGTRTLWLVTSRYIDKSGIWANGCRIYHFDAPAPIAPEVLTALMGRPNTGTQALPAGHTKYLWEPGWKSGHSVEISFMQGDDQVASQYGLKGLVLTTQALGGF